MRALWCIQNTLDCYGAPCNFHFWNQDTPLIRIFSPVSLHTHKNHCSNTLSILLKLHFLFLQTRKSGSYQSISPATISTMQRADKKLTFIPVVFIFLRIWGTLQFFYATGIAHLTYYGCVPEQYGLGFTILAYIQVCMYTLTPQAYRASWHIYGNTTMLIM